MLTGIKRLGSPTTMRAKFWRYRLHSERGTIIRMGKDQMNRGHVNKKSRKESVTSFSRAKKLGLLAMLLTAAVIILALCSVRRRDPASAGGSPASMPLGFSATIVNSGKGPGDAPAGMVWIPGGEFSMGANDPPDMDEVGMKQTSDARPIHRVYVDGFFMDKTDVTNQEFARFAKATGYITVAERKPRAEDFPGAPPENLVAGEWFLHLRIIRYL